MAHVTIEKICLIQTSEKTKRLILLNGVSFLEKIFVRLCSWLGFILLLLAVSSDFIGVSLLSSPFITFYLISVIGLIVACMGWVLLRFNEVDSITKIVGKLGLLGNLTVVILFFPPLFHFWGTFIFGP
ncbi:hypothetical protein JNUCC74_18310 [Cerasibacillus sp. JNUCC 74]